MEVRVVIEELQVAMPPECDCADYTIEVLEETAARWKRIWREFDEMQLEIFACVKASLGIGT